MRVILSGLLWWSMVAVSLPSVWAQRPQIDVAVVVDGPWRRNAEILDTTREEVSLLTQQEFQVRFPEEFTMVADWTVEGVRSAVEEMMAHPEVDAVIAWGVLSSDIASRLSEYPKPVIAPVVLDPGLQGVPVQTRRDPFEADRVERVSGVHNLTYITWPSQLEDDIRVFYEVYPFRKLGYLISEGFARANPELPRNLKEEFGNLGLNAELEIVPVALEAETALSGLSQDADAVYVGALLQLPAPEWEALAAGLIERDLPSFSFFGREEVEQGLLASMSLGTDFRRLARRIALYLHRILRGDDAGTLPVSFARQRRLTLNMATARAIDLSPSWAIITEAELLHEERVGIQRTISLRGAVVEAVRQNLDLAAADRSVLKGSAEEELAHAVFLPQVDLLGLSAVIDRDRAEASLGSQGRLNLAGTAAVTQLLFSEPARANRDVQRHLQQTRLEEREALRLDIGSSAALAYLDVLRAQTLYSIERQNLRRTRSHLEIARDRRNIGVANPAEVYRWESEIATSLRDVVRANAARNVAEIAVNRLLHRPLEEVFRTVEADLEDPGLQTAFGDLREYVDNPADFQTFRNFMVREGLAASPELRRFDAAVQAQNRAILAARRAFYLPEIALSGEVTTRATAGGGFELDPALALPFSPQEIFPSVGNVDWNVAVSARFPLFQGGAREVELFQARQELAQLELERRAAAERIEQRIRSALHLTGASFASIDLARDSASAARQNLQLVTDAYREGLLSTTDLIDAQNAALVADRVAANAVYDYLIDLMNVQRAIGRLDFLTSADQLQAWRDRLDAFFVEEASGRD